MVTVSTSPQISPHRILSTLQAYRDAAALNTAIELDLFTRIAHGADTAATIAGEIGVPVRGIRLLCDYLASAGMLEKEDEQLKLTGDAYARFLDKEVPGISRRSRAHAAISIVVARLRTVDRIGTRGGSPRPRGSEVDCRSGLVRCSAWHLRSDRGRGGLRSNRELSCRTTAQVPEHWRR